MRSFTAGHNGQPERQGSKRPADSGSSDKRGFLWGLLGLGMPLVGLVLYLVWKDQKPAAAKAAAKGALINIICGVMLIVLQAVVGLLSMLPM